MIYVGAFDSLTLGAFFNALQRGPEWMIRYKSTTFSAAAAAAAVAVAAVVVERIILHE